MIFDDDIDTSVKPARLSEKSFQLIKKRVKNQVENPTDVDLYFQVNTINTEQNKTESFNSTEIPSLVGSNIDYVIITNESLKEKFEQISDWKTKKGLPSVVRTVEWIDDHYSGSDGAEKIRNFIIDANTKWGAIWFLMGGDDNIVPLRYAWISNWNHWQLVDLIPNGEFIPTDMYYACLDGNWNADGDATFGEGSYNRNNDGTFSFVGNSAKIDNVDLGPDVNISRIPVQNETEFDHYITKYFEYIKNSSGNENNVLLFSANSDGISSSEMNIVYNKFPTYTNRTRLYEDYLDVKEDVLNALNAVSPNPNYHIICGYGHGSPSNFEACKGNINRSEFDILQNNDRSEIIYLNHCETMAWDKDCVGEHFIGSENGGVAFIGNTRFGWTGDPSKYNDDFIDALYNRGHYLINETFYYSKTFNIGDAYKDEKDRWGFFALNISADPEMPVWTNVPQTLLVNHPGTVANGENIFTVTINNLPAGQDAVVCLKKDMEDYAFQTVTGTGSAVQVNFTFTPDTPGNLDVTVTAHNFIPYEAVVPVNTISGVHLFIADNTVDDDDAGETIELTTTLENSGSQNAANVTATLSCVSPYITITQNQSGYGAINAQSQAVCQTKYILQVDKNTPDDESIELTVNIQDGTDNYTDKFFIQVGAPELDHIKNIVIANSQIVLIPYQSVDLNLELLNTGDAQATGISATLSTSASGVYILNSTASFPDIDAYSSSQSSAPFRFMVSSGYTGLPIPFTVNVLNEYGKSWVYNFEIDDPPGIDINSLEFTGYLNEIDLWWDPVSGVRGYNIYRSDTEAGTYSKINNYIVEGTSYFKDTELVEKTNYYYKVGIIDLNANESGLSFSFKAWTTLPFYGDWPILTAKSGRIMGGPTVANVDDDPEKEIFLGNKEGIVMGWNPNGDELFDIDNNPTTVSGFYDLDGSWCAATPVIADINLDGKQEIIITTRDGGSNPGKVYVFNAEDLNSDSKPDKLWEFDLGGPNLRGIVAADIDNDGYMEIIGHKEGSNPVYYILNHDGTVQNSWTVNTGGAGSNYSLPAIVDLNNDGYKEIIEGFADGKLYIWDHQGNDYNTNPVFNTRDYYSNSYNNMPPIVADVDKDGNYEIFIAATVSGSTLGYLYGIDETGSFKTNWNGKPFYLNGHETLPPSVTIADIDGNIKIFFAYENYVKVWDANGNEVLSIDEPGLTITSASPNIADIDGNGDLEIIVPSRNGNIYAYKQNGARITGWPLRVGSSVLCNPVIADIDGNGKSEIITGDYSGKVSIWETDGDPGLIEWGHYRHNNRQDGLYAAVKSGVISSNQIWSGTIDIIGDITINSGVTLTIMQNSHLRLVNSKKIIVNGTLNVNGTSSNPVTFTRPTGTTLLWNGIQVYGNSTIDHAIIEHAQKGVQFYSGSSGSVTSSEIRDNTYGVYIKDTTNPLVFNCQIYDNASYGIYVYNSNSSSDWLELRNNTVYDNDYCGIHLSNSSPFIFGNEIYNHTYGVIAVVNSSPYLGDYDEYGNNNIHTNNYGLAASVSNPFLGEETCSIHGGNNQFSSNSIHHIYAINNSYVQAELNWWGSNPPQSSKFNATGGSSIDYSPWLTSMPGGSMLISGSPETNLYENDFLTMEISKGEQNLNYMDYFNPKWPLDRQLVFARDIMWLGDIESCQAICKDVINSYPDSSLSFFALDILWQSSRKAEKAGAYDFESFKQYVHDLSVKKDKKTLYGYSELLSAEFENNKSLASASDNVYTKYEGSILPKIALYKKFIYYFNDLNDHLKAKEVADQLQREFPNSLEASSALAHFQKDQQPIQKVELADNLETAKQIAIPMKYSLSSNYPNPFNPTTSVEFALPKVSNVDISVYNSLGQFVNKVSFSSLSAGFHIFKWNGKNDKHTILPSGLYFLHFEAKSLTEEREVFNKSIKMLLLR